MCDRLSRDYGWTLCEILALTPSEVLLYVERRTVGKRMLMSTREARASVVAARERRRDWVEQELGRDGSLIDEVEACGDWERLVVWSQRIGDESLPETDDATPDDSHFATHTLRDSERLRRICDELRMIRAALSSSARRAWSE